VITDVLALARRELAGRRIEVHTELPEDLPRVLGDRVQLQQVLLNLVMNGIEAMSGMARERRVLTIGGRRDELSGSPAVWVMVQDLGSGVEPENMERLFEAFYSTKPQGMGMGAADQPLHRGSPRRRLWAAPNAGPRRDVLVRSSRGNLQRVMTRLEPSFSCLVNLLRRKGKSISAG
jgi:hypothetical protein